MDDQRINERLDETAAGISGYLEDSRNGLTRLLSIMADLRGAGGCPWDAEQSLASLRQYILEEAAEVAEAIDNILKFEDALRERHGLAQADPAPPDGTEKARTEKKGLSIAHHPHRSDFDPLTSASGAPLPEAISDDDHRELDRLYSQMQDEVGDIMLQGAFLGDILRNMGRGGLDVSLGLIAAKLIRRHPHIYGDVEAADSTEVLNNWEAIKARERTGK